MKHKSGFNTLNMKSGRRKAVKRSMVTSVFKYERIKTTKARALEVRRMAEKMITRAKTDSVHNRRIIAAYINDEAVLAKLFTEIAPRYATRNGGYTRILKLGRRGNDAAEVVFLELVDRKVKEKKVKKDKAAKEEEAKAPAKEA
ncbi:MAG: 50S ribosomal protein L17 [Spirochaetia bacterium]|nr:50S ribosomal protein L17 [Spirochaetia bacterium]